jgi:hypothetical protein
LKKILAIIALLVLVGLWTAVPTEQSSSRTEAREESLIVTSEPFTMDQSYESMAGPGSLINGFSLSDKPEDAGKVFWLKSIRVEALQPDGQPASNEYFCHANLKFDIPSPVHNSRFRERHHMPKRLLTLTEGRMRIDLPEGFGIPVFAETELGFDTMSHNLNHDPSQDAPRVKFRATVDFLTSGREKGKELRPLFRRTVYMYDATDKPDFQALAESDEEFCGTVDAQIKGLPRIGDNPIHWSVPPGVHTYVLPADEQLFLSFDTTVHYAAAHFHQYCTWMRLVDKSTGKTILEFKGTPYPGERGMAAISDVVSQEGISLSSRASYELQVCYDNPTDKNIDAMAILYLYLLEPVSSRTTD